jgi:hypothetical protein
VARKHDEKQELLELTLQSRKRTLLRLVRTWQKAGRYPHQQIPELFVVLLQNDDPLVDAVAQTAFTGLQENHSSKSDKNSKLTSLARG